MKDLSKPRQDGQERWREPGWAAQTRGCLSGRLARSGTRCGRAAGWASGSSGKSQWRGCPPREQPVKQPFDLLQCWKLVTSLHGDIAYLYLCKYSRPGWNGYLWQPERSPFPESRSCREDIQMNVKLCAVTQRLYAAVSEDFSTLGLMIMPLTSY